LYRKAGAGAGATHGEKGDQEVIDGGILEATLARLGERRTGEICDDLAQLLLMDGSHSSSSTEERHTTSSGFFESILALAADTLSGDNCLEMDDKRCCGEDMAAMW
jgi:hypothetical protein